MSYYRIPINNAPNSEYAFRISMRNNTVNLDIRVKMRYMDIYDVWLMDVYDDRAGKLLVAGIPVVLGTNLLGQYTYLNIGEAYILNVKNSPLMHPNNKTLGSDFILVWGDNT